MGEQLFGLLGQKLGHSWSVAIHKALGCGAYRLYEKEPEELESFLRDSDIGGLNVTIPYKRAVMPYCDVIDDEALKIGSVNTLVRRKDGKLYAWNTDAAGFEWMARRAHIDFHGQKTLVLGSGGASLTAQTVAKRLGAREVVVVSRNGADNYQNINKHADAGIVINATPVGTYPDVGKAVVDLRSFPACKGVLDVIYNPRRTALIMQAEQLGIPCSDGLPMLVKQAVSAQEHFFDRQIPSCTVDDILAHMRRQTQNIVLIGMPGCGKTTVGVLLARLAHREAIDIDARIEEKAGCTIPEIFARDGEPAFRAMELHEIAEAGKQSGKVIITGGGAVLDQRNYPLLHQNGRIYQLERQLELLSVEGRPLSQTGLRELASRRANAYARFRDIVIDNNRPLKETAAAIWRDFYEHFDS